MPRKKKTEQVSSYTKKQQEIANSKDPDFLLGDRRKPRGWAKLTY